MSERSLAWRRLLYDEMSRSPPEDDAGVGWTDEVVAEAAAVAVGATGAATATAAAAAADNERPSADRIRKNLVFTNRDGTEIVPFADVIGEFRKTLPADNLASMAGEILMFALRQGRGFVVECRLTGTLKKFSMKGRMVRLSEKELLRSSVQAYRRIDFYDATDNCSRTKRKGTCCSFSLHLTSDVVPTICHVSWNGIHFTPESMAEYLATPCVAAEELGSTKEKKRAARGLLGSYERTVAAIPDAPSSMGRSLTATSAAAIRRWTAVPRAETNERPKARQEKQAGTGGNGRPGKGPDVQTGIPRRVSLPGVASAPERRARVEEAAEPELSPADKVTLMTMVMRSIFDRPTVCSEIEVQKMSDLLQRECANNPVLTSAIRRMVREEKNLGDVKDEWNRPSTSSVAEESLANDGRATYTSNAGNPTSTMRNTAPAGKPSPTDLYTIPRKTSEHGDTAASSLKRGRSLSPDRFTMGVPHASASGGNKFAKTKSPPHMRHPVGRSGSERTLMQHSSRTHRVESQYGLL